MAIRRYTSTDKSIVLKWMQQYPDNIDYATSKAAEELGRTHHGVLLKYYKTWRFDPEFKAIAVGSKKGFTHNVKNTLRVDGVFPEDRTLNSVEWLMKQFLELSVKERESIFNFFISTGSIKINSIGKAKSVKISQ